MMSQFSHKLAAMAAAPVLLFSISADGAMMNYGSFVGNTVTFVDVIEDSLGSSLLYEDFAVFDDTLLFDTSGFGVQVSPGPGSSFLDSELGMMIVANDGYAITSIDYAEGGDFTLFGDGFVSVGLPYFWEILEVDGVAISPIAGNGQVSLMSTSIGAGQLWNLDFNIDVEQELTLAETVLGEIGTSVTKINLRFDNTLTATANDVTSVAFVKKKQIGGVTVGSTEFVPEPASAFSLVVGLLGLMMRRRS